MPQYFSGQNVALPSQPFLYSAPTDPPLLPAFLSTPGNALSLPYPSSQLLAPITQNACTSGLMDMGSLFPAGGEGNMLPTLNPGLKPD